MTVKERLLSINLEERIKRNPEYANIIGLRLIKDRDGCSESHDFSNHKLNDGGLYE